MHRARMAEFPQSVRDKMKTMDIPKMMEEVKKSFAKADADGDGALNEDEFIAFRKMFTDYQAAVNGDGVNIPEDLDRVAWSRLNATFPDHENVVHDDLMKIFKTFGELGPKPETEVRVWYFAGMYGRAEPIRLLLTHAGIPWEDIGVQMGDWPHLKRMVPGGSLPLVEMKDGSMKGGATRAVVRFFSLKHGYYPDDPMQAQQCDMIVDAFQDCFELSGDAAFGKGFDKATIPESQAKYWAKLCDFLTFLEPYCAKKQFLCGAKPCAADFWVGSMVVSLIKNPNVMFGQGDDDNSWNGMNRKFPEFKGWSDRFVAANQTRMNTRAGCPF